jgi:hypothetical protein
MSLIPTGFAKNAAAGGFYSTTIDQSLRFNDNDSAYLSRTPASAGNRKTWTWSGWVKRGNLGAYQALFSGGDATSNNDAWLRIGAGSGNIDAIEFRNITGGSYTANVYTSAVFRDVSAWYHVVLAVDTTQATSTNRIKIYVNGEQQAVTFATTPAQNSDMSINIAGLHTISKLSYAAVSYLDAYLTEVNFIDGTALDATDFGEFKSGVWIPKAYSGSYGTNGFYLPLTSDANDDSGNGNNFTANNLASTDYVLDSPTNNFATLNPLDDEYTTSEGNLKATYPFTYWYNGRSTFTAPSGKWYFESVITSMPGTSYAAFGVRKTSTSLGSGYIGDTAGDAGLNFGYSGGYYKNNATTNTLISGVTTAVGQVLQCALDLDNKKIWFGVNNTWLESGNPSTDTNPMFTGLADDVTPAISIYNSFIQVLNFGQDSSFAGNKTAQGNTDDNGYGDFYYAPPSGYLALCTANLPDPVASIDPAQDGSPQDHFNTVLYTGNGSTQSITGVGFQPDLVIMKSRNYVYNHWTFDSVRSTGNLLSTNLTDSEASYPSILSSFDSDGFTTNTNGSFYSFVAWNWKAGGSGVSNTDGSITSTVSANTDAGFSIVSYTGNGTADSTIGHGLTSAPEMIIVKERSEARGWAVYHETLGYTKEVYLNYTQAATTSNFWRSAPTSSTFAVSTSNYVNSNTQDYIAYCFHSVEGFSKFGSYTGNGSTDGPFVYTGFRPAFVMIKRSDASGYNWTILDGERTPYNVMNGYLCPDSSAAEATGYNQVDFTSNGFKIRQQYGNINATGNNIYMAFAENPFKYANAR